MHKKIGAILLVAGTCIGSGMIALPLVLAKLGLIPSILLMLAIWCVMYYTSLVNLELNLQVGRGLALGALGKYFSGKITELLGTISLKLLSYSLLAVFIYGGASILQELMASKKFGNYTFGTIATGYSFVAIGLLLLPMKLIDYLNRFLFVGLIAVVAILIAGLAITINWSNVPLFAEHYNQPLVWVALVPVVFTSFGFQVIFHTLTNYCGKNVKLLKQAFLWGSLLPAAVYIVWTCSILSAVYQGNPHFYSQMAAGKAEIGELIQVLSGIAKSQSIQILIWWISLLAIATSVLGVGVGLCDSLKEMLSNRLPNSRVRNVVASIVTVFPAYVVVMYVPNAFITILGFAGMILALIAILLPVYLLWQSKTDRFYYSELNKRSLILISILFALLVIFCELFNIIN